MTNRELFHATMRRENGEKLLHMEQGFGVLYTDWIEDGLPSHISDTSLGKASIDYVPDLYDYFNVALDHWAFWGTTFEGYKHYSESLERYGKANRVTRASM